MSEFIQVLPENMPEFESLGRTLVVREVVYAYNPDGTAVKRPIDTKVFSSLGRDCFKWVCARPDCHHDLSISITGSQMGAYIEDQHLVMLSNMQTGTSPLQKRPLYTVSSKRYEFLDIKIFLEDQGVDIYQNSAVVSLTMNTPPKFEIGINPGEHTVEKLGDTLLKAMKRTNKVLGMLLTGISDNPMGKNNQPI